MSRLSTIVLALAFWGAAQAAEELPSSSPSGILINRVMELADLDGLNGSTVADTASPARWRQAIFELRRAADTELGWPDVRSMANQAVRQADRNEVPLGLLWASYNRLQSDQSMISEEVFAFAPLRQSSYYGDRVRFTLAPSGQLVHEAPAIVDVQMDAGDGLGLRPLDPVYGLEASYSSTGPKRLKLQATLAGGRKLLAFSSLDVKQLATPDPSAAWTITASQDFEGEFGTGQAYLYLADGHLELTNPVVVVEGFDIDNSIDWPVLYDLLNRENLLEDLRAAGYDLVVLDFTEAVDPIQRNAFVLTELLDRVNAETAPSQSQVLIGASMGGLVSRYALLWMEQQNIPHRVRSYISFDTPQSGANIPLGIQEWVAFFAGEAEEAAFLISRLNAPASRQMLLYHLQSTAGTTANADPLLSVLNNDFSAMGGWPQDARRVSIVNGSGTMAGQGFSAGEQVIIYEYRSFLVDIDGDVWAVPDGGSQIIFDGRINPLIGSTNSKLVTIAGTLPWDNSPGGSRNSMQQLADTTAPYGDIQAAYNNHSFIPTVSALALITNDPFYDVAGDINLLQNTPFNQVYFPAENQEHIDINAENKPWFLGEIQAEINVSLISGNTTEQGGAASFEVAALYPPGAPVSIALMSSNTAEGNVAAEVVLPAGSTVPQTVTVTGVDDTVIDGSKTYQVITGIAVSADKAYSGRNPPDVTVINLDDEPEEFFIDGFES